MTIDMKPVTSSQISAVGYDADSQTLAIRFADRVRKDGTPIPGATYHYYDIPQAAHQALVGSDSIGSHFHQHIRSNPAIRYEKVM